MTSSCLGKNVEGAGFPFQVNSLEEEYEKYEWEQKSLSGLDDRVSMRRHGCGRVRAWQVIWIQRTRLAVRARRCRQGRSVGHHGNRFRTWKDVSYRRLHIHPTIKPGYETLLRTRLCGKAIRLHQVYEAVLELKFLFSAPKQSGWQSLQSAEGG